MLPSIGDTPSIESLTDMADSLQEQLVRAGLAEPDQAKKGKSGAGKPRNKDKGRGKGKGKGKPRATQRAAPQAADQAGASQHSAPPRDAHERTARMRGLVAKHRLPRQDGRVPYRFTLGRRIKEITVTSEQQRQLARGEAGIVNVQGRFDVLPAHAIESLRQLDPEAVVLLNGPDASDTAADAEAHSDRPVPDDLMW